MSTTPRIDSAIPGAPSEFGTVMSHAPDIIAKFGELYAEFWQQGLISQEVKEMTRIRNARITDCGF
ncbi:hypothetical protein OAL10_09450 [Gammaproteobacteria bacterium]|jgi:hypothetical protein|nr:hypothetical protein [Gammaproteobacteria bacterium]